MFQFLNKININTIMTSILPVSYFIWSFDFSGAIMVLFLLMCLDFITGIRKAMFLGCLSSTIARKKSFEKSLNYGTFLIVGYLINMFFLSLEPTGYVAKFIMNLIGEFIQYIFIVFTGFLIGVEGWSVIENLNVIGMPIPQKLINLWGKNIKDETCKKE